MISAEIEQGLFEPNKIHASMENESIDEYSES